MFLAPLPVITSVFAVMAEAERHTFMVLTKSAPEMRDAIERVRPAVAEAWECFDGGRFPWPLPNVWLGVSVRNQEEADARREYLRALADWHTWVSYEPAIGPVCWNGWQFVRFVVDGGESGSRARPSHPKWHRDTRDFCQAYRIPFMFKQWGEWAPAQVAIKAGSSGAHEYVDSGCGCGEREFMMRVGKQAAGCLLDGKQYRGLPIG